MAVIAFPIFSHYDHELNITITAAKEEIGSYGTLRRLVFFDFSVAAPACSQENFRLRS